MPILNLHVMGMPNGAPAFTAAVTMARSSCRFTGTAAPPPRRVTFGAGQPKLRSMWSTALARPNFSIARVSIAGSLPYSCSERNVSSAPNFIIVSVFLLPCTRPVAIIISLTYTSPGPNLRHRLRNGALVTPAIGANTTGGQTLCSPSCSGFSEVVGDVI